MDKGKTIEDIDQNFRAQEINSRKYHFLDIAAKPLQLDGFAWLGEEKEFCRLPARMISKESPLNDDAKTLSWRSSGAVVRFKTNSQSIALKAELRDNGIMAHMPLSGMSGFDLYLNTGRGLTFCRNIRPTSAKPGFVEGVFSENLGAEMRECAIYLPLYNGIKTVEVGFAPGAEVQSPEPLKYPDPVLFYGSSITQGGCASRPGNAYTHFLTRWLGANMINLGFSGSGRGEIVMAECIASLKLSAFVMDYDHNAPDPGHLGDTHENFFNAIRKKQPELPIVMLSKCDFENGDPEINSKRREIIKRTYSNAVKAGDRNVYFIDGETLFGKTHRDACTVDGCHPNDIGFLRMAETILPVLKKALKAPSN
jgi:lysophospholipase L1-like esterase